MVLGLRTKTRKSPSVQLDYIIHIQEIKPWPPSQSLRNLRAVLIQWEHGEKTSGWTNQVVPSLGNGAGAGDGRIEFNESFRLTFILSREMSMRSGEADSFQKNCIEFHLYEPRRDKTVKGQQLGTAVLDLAEYGIVRENLSVNVPINCKRTYGNTSQPLLCLKIQPVGRNRASLIQEASMDRNKGESVSALMTEEYEEEAEVASFITDDDVSSHSSLAVTSSAAGSNGGASPQNKENEAGAVNGRSRETQLDYVNVRSREAKAEHVRDQFVAKPNEENSASSSHSSSIGLSSDIAWLSKRITSQSLQSSADKRQNSNMKCNEHEKEAEGIQENVVNGVSTDEGKHNSSIAKETVAGLDYSWGKRLESRFSHLQDKKHEYLKKPSITTDDEARENYGEGQNIEDDRLADFSQVGMQEQVKLENGLLSSNKESSANHSSFSDIDRSNHGTSGTSSLDSSRIVGSTRRKHSFVAGSARGSINSERKDAKANVKETRSLVSDGRVQHLENRIKVLESELREAAAMEVSLYSVSAEHGSSMTKVHAPARRLLRLYFHAKRQNSKSGRGTAAKSVVSGLVLVAKACGNDVPRLTFWLSNCIVLRVMVNKSSGDGPLPISAGPNNGKLSDKSGKKKPLPLKWEQTTSKSRRIAIEDSVGDLENPLNFIAALEKVEAWIFSRIIESLWWQTFTPHMQSGAAKAIRKSMNSETRKLYRRTSSSIDQQQGNFSLELWKKAFRDASERICPVRAEGHDCGCLPLLSKLIMEQLIARLDVAMFNAILRESAHEIPTDPVADPISDADVLPIPAAKASFGAGAQLKNAIGDWSRWLTDLFGIDDGDEGSIENEYISMSHDTSSKSFHLLNALSDLMMLPKDMLLSQTVRKEVCPMFGPALIRRILNSFTPDEFCPDPIPGVVLEALNSEDPFDCEEDSITSFPCLAAPIAYQTPSAASVSSILGETSSHSKLTRSRSSVLKKSQTSDDELDELDSPLKAIILDSSQESPSLGRPVWLSKEFGNRNTVRYQLLKEVWMISE